MIMVLSGKDVQISTEVGLQTYMHKLHFPESNFRGGGVGVVNDDNA